MPATQPLVERQIIKEKNESAISYLLEENAMLRQLLRDNRDKIGKLRYRALEAVHEPLEEKKTTFTRACPDSECRGFLSTAYKCGICETYTCKHCNTQKVNKNDPDHKCDPELVETFKLLASDTKPCPGCTAPIHKIEGCDQMFCTLCHTAFSWKSGAIELGVIHNPHYYEFQRIANGGVAPRVNGDMRCGGAPLFWQIRDHLLYHHCLERGIDDAHRLIQHITYVVLPQHPNIVDRYDNSKLRIEYLMKRIDKKKLLSKIKQKMKKQEKDSELHMVLTMFTSTMSDLFSNIISGEPRDIKNSIDSMYKLRTYTNESFKNIGKQFDNVVPFIDDDWKYWNNSKKVKST